MLQKIFFVCLFFWFQGIFAQESELLQTKKFAVSDTIFLQKTSINTSGFSVIDDNDVKIDSSFYSINFAKATLVLNKLKFVNKDSIVVQFTKYPDFLTRAYAVFEQEKVMSNDASASSLYKIEKPNSKKNIPFDGLNTSGSITRGISVGNNQNAVVNSTLDLQISGKISDKVTLQASIQDSNIPLQQGGYSQTLDEFDQIFIEMFSEKWRVRGGDLFLENRNSKLLNFNKKVQGLNVNYTFGKKENQTNVFGAAALVRGQYAKSSFIGQEGNQGPYKLKGPNNELFVLVISGSERVFVNGIMLKRGENNDYIIDYNAGEIRFTSLFTVTSEMRINIEYQFSDRNFSRFVTYAGASHDRKNWNIGTKLYLESDAKNRPLQQLLSGNQVQNLVNAGDNPLLMVAPSAIEDTYSVNKILYQKISVGNSFYYEFSNNTSVTLFAVKFSFVGNNLGNYTLINTNTIGKIYKYVAPINGVSQGSYESVIQLIAPTKIEIATIFGKYNPSPKAFLDFEIGLSNQDKNLFSKIDDTNNKGLAGSFNFLKKWNAKKWKFDWFGNYQFVQNNFRTIERLFAIEFNRDWNITNPKGLQQLFQSGFSAQLPSKFDFNYRFEKLLFSENFDGSRQVLSNSFRFKKLHFVSNSSFLSSDGNLSASKFLRSETRLKFNFKKNWIGNSFRLEDNKEKLKINNQFTGLSQKFSEYGFFAGRGDSTKVFVEIGYLKRSNDSLVNGSIFRVNNSDSYFLKSKLIQTSKSNLAIFFNYRDLKFVAASQKNEPSLNSRILYNNSFFKQLLQFSTVYENMSGTIAQQEFTYVEVDSGRGFYTWNDYNNNQIQELEEFEIAQFSDQAKYIRVFLPNQIFVKTQQNKFSQSVVFNPIQWQNKSGFKKIVSHFYNQTTYLSDRKLLKTGNNFDLNPFTNNIDGLLGRNLNFRNNLFYNRGKQLHSVTYSYSISSNTNLLLSGSQQSINKFNMLQYQHLLAKTWLVSLDSKKGLTSFDSQNFISRNYNFDIFSVLPKVAYIVNKNTSLDLFLEFQTKNNSIGSKESLKQQKIGLNFVYTGEKQYSINGGITYLNNNFSGNSLTPVAFQMLEQLQNGKNVVGQLLLQKKINSFLDININYQGRKSEKSNSIHVGSVQLRGFF